MTRDAAEPFDVAQSSHELVTRSAAMIQLTRRFNQSAPSVIHFDFNSDRLDWRARRILDAQAEWIIQHPNVRFSVTGHTDKVGTNAYNDDLGLRRAKVALAYLVAQGVEEFRLIAMVSEGEDHPVVNVDTQERANRRVETEVIGIVGDSHRRLRAGGWVMSTSDHGGRPGPSDEGTETPNGPAPSDPPAGDPPAGDPPGYEPPANDPPPGTPPANDPPQSPNDKPKGYEKEGHADAGRGNGDDVTDPGGSAGKNNGGDETGSTSPGRGKPG